MRLLRGRLGPLLLAGMAAVVAAACENTVGLADTEEGFDAVWAGKPWEGDASATRVSAGTAGETLYLYGSTPRNAGQMPAAYLRIRITQPAVGSRPLAPGDVEMVYLVGGDVRTAAYVNGGSDPGNLLIRQYGGGWVSGAVVFGASAAMEHMPVGASARFEGSFRARIRDEQR